MSRIRLALFRDHSAAESVRRGLLQAGIPAEIHDELQLERLWFVSKSATGVRLEVPAKLFERAAELLCEWDVADGRLDQAIRCPECKSLHVDYPQFARRSLFTNLAMGLIAELRLVERQYYCEDCHCMWSKEAKAPRKRLHLAPNYFVENIQSIAPSPEEREKKVEH
jgi:predicted Zn-ribbon and HTH transcriptional regulator